MDVATEASNKPEILSSGAVLGLIKDLVDQGKSGLLTLELSEHKGSIYFSGGQIFKATLSGLKPVRAFLEMASWNQCSYEFKPHVFMSRRSITTPTTQLLKAAEATVLTR